MRILEEQEQMKSIAFYKEKAKEDPDTYEPKVAELLNSLATQIGESDEERSEQLYLEALEIRRRLAAKNPEEYEPALAETARSIGLLNSNREYYKTSVKYLLEALKYYRRCVQREPETYEAVLGVILFSLGLIYHLNRHYITCVKYYLEAREISQRPSVQNSEKYVHYFEQLNDAMKEYKNDTAHLSESEKRQLEEQALEDPEGEDMGDF